MTSNCCWWRWLVLRVPVCVAQRWNKVASAHGSNVWPAACFHDTRNVLTFLLYQASCWQSPLFNISSNQGRILWRSRGRIGFRSITLNVREPDFVDFGRPLGMIKSTTAKHTTHYFQQLYKWSTTWCGYLNVRPLMTSNSKTVPCFSPMHKEGNKLCIIYPLIYGSMLYYFYSPRNQTTSCQYKLSKTLVYRIKEAQL